MFWFNSTVFFRKFLQVNTKKLRKVFISLHLYRYNLQVYNKVIVSDEPIDLPATLDGGQAFRWWLQADGSWRGIIGKYVIKIVQSSSTQIAVEALNATDQDNWQQKVNYYFHQQSTHRQLLERFRNDACVFSALTTFPGLRLLRQDPWECLVTFITSAVSNIPRIKKNIDSIAALGERIGDGLHDYQFPTPERIIDTGTSTLRSFRLGFRADYIVKAAYAVAEGTINLESLYSETFEESRKQLTNLTGVGPKIADCVLGFSLDKGEAFAVDRHVRRAVERWYGIPKSFTNEQVADKGRELFNKDSAIIQQYIFHQERIDNSVNRKIL